MRASHALLSLLAFASCAACVDHTRVANAVRRDVCQQPHALSRRDDPDVGVGVGAGVTLPSVGLSLGNITTKLGNINLTVTNVTISVGDVEVSDISIGNISIIVSVPLPGASPVNAFSAMTPARSITTSTNTPTSTVSPGTSVTSTATTLTSSGGVLFRRQDGPSSDPDPTPSPTEPDPSTSVSATATVGGGPIGLDAGNVITEIGNITIFVGHVNVSLGNVNIRNVSIGNILVYVQIGQPDLAGITGNLTNSLGNIPRALDPAR